MCVWGGRGGVMDRHVIARYRPTPVPDPNKPSPASDAPRGPGFDDAMSQIESIIESIESGELGLEESIAAYERAATLMKGCRDHLRAAELRVEEITAMLQDNAPDASRSEPGEP